jgi:hypothetical protein
MAIYSGIYAVYERLASAKMNEMVAAINAHTHDGTYGVQINFNDLAGTLDPGQIPNDTIDGDMIADNSIGSNHIINYAIKYEDLDSIDYGATQTIKMRDGYAVYAP